MPSSAICAANAFDRLGPLPLQKIDPAINRLCCSSDLTHETRGRPPGPKNIDMPAPGSERVARPAFVLFRPYFFFRLL